ncbi:MAG: YebC/PmpR family DNA-binding transcriptional regulator [Planctomycetaceae bacterium]|nr:YebC/PmpR family DNA-binding transcriptional regulator [Planctomycetaceae bacterium]
MAGHSHWANIAHKKGRIDKKRGALFGKLSRAIIVAARRGGGDPAMNLALRYAVDKARKQSMPKDNIERAIKRGLGESDGADYEEILYEGYGVAGVAVLCETLTDNRKRTVDEVRKLFEVHGGNMGNSGCVAWMFERKGLFTVPQSAISEEELFEFALEAGADDVQESGENFEVTCSADVFQQVADAFEAKGIPTDVSEITRIPNSVVELGAEDGQRILKLLDALEELEDVQNVTANFNIPDDVMAELMGNDD